MPRLFTGISLPQTYRTALSLMQSGLPEARWIEPTDLHITLRFIGDVSYKTADEIGLALAQHSWKSPQLKLGEVASFGKERPRSVHMAVQPDDTLSHLQMVQETLMQRLGLPAEKRKFMPHITLARSSKWHSFDVKTWLAQSGGLFLPPFTPTEFHLYSARESTGGGPYVIQQSFPLFPKT